MARGRQTFSAEFKAKVALEAIKGMKTINELAREYQVHPNAISLWKKQMLENIADIFTSKRGPKTETNEELTDKLYRQIGKLQVELDWLKKKYESIS
jgi:putative transposase